VIVGEFAYGNPESVGEPLGLWGVQSDVTGDASGGFLQVSCRPQNPTDTPTLDDRRRQYVYFLDYATIFANTEPGPLTAEVRMHFARSNAAITPPIRAVVTRDALQGQTNLFSPDAPLLPPNVERWPIFWDTQELAAGDDNIVILSALINTLATIYRVRAFGRYYDRQILSNRAFGRLVAEPSDLPVR